MEILLTTMYFGTQENESRGNNEKSGITLQRTTFGSTHKAGVACH